jgi:hypothetical protein
VGLAFHNISDEHGGVIFESAMRFWNVRRWNFAEVKEATFAELI